MIDIKELNDEELEQVSGGSQPNTKEQGPKYSVNTQIKGYTHECVLIIGTIISFYWDFSKNQYVYSVEHEATRYIVPKSTENQVQWLPAGKHYVNEEDILYDL